jgi:hypothetical protein
MKIITFWDMMCIPVEIYRHFGRNLEYQQYFLRKVSKFLSDYGVLHLQKVTIFMLSALSQS